MGLSIVLPTYNEKKNLIVLIPQIEKEFAKIDHEILIVDDSSPDGTASYVKSLDNKNIRLILRNKKEGIGAALREGYLKATKDIILSSDSDLSFDVKDMHKLLNKIDEGYDLVVGTRHLKKKFYETKRLSTRIKYTVSKIGNTVTSVLSGVDITDFSANFRAMKRDVFKKILLKEKTNSILLEMIMKVNYHGYKVAEIPVNFKERKYGKSKLNLFVEAPKFFLKLTKFILLYRILRSDKLEK